MSNQQGERDEAYSLASMSFVPSFFFPSTPALMLSCIGARGFGFARWWYLCVFSFTRGLFLLSFQGFTLMKIRKESKAGWDERRAGVLHQFSLLHFLPSHCLIQIPFLPFFPSLCLSLSSSVLVLSYLHRASTNSPEKKGRRRERDENWSRKSGSGSPTRKEREK